MDKNELIKRLKEQESAHQVDDYSEGFDDGIVFALGLAERLEEPQKPVVPSFVAEWIEDYKEQGYSAINAVFNIVSGAEDLYMEEYLRENLRTFIDAWDNGYEVEKEQKYYVKEPTTGQFLIKDNQQSSGVKWVDGFSSNPESYTEKEIKDITDRFWSFALPVEEEEE